MFGKSEKLLEDINNLLEHHLEEKLNHAFANSFNNYLEKFRLIVDQEKELIEKSASKAIEQINVASIKLADIDGLVSSNQKLSKEVLKLADEIRKRDAIIERKNRQLLKLKEIG